MTCGSVEAAAFDEFVDWLRRLYLVEMPHFIDRNFDSPLGLLSAPAALARLVALGGFGKLGPTIRRRFDDPRLHRLFSFQALYAGLSPESALALYAVITYMDSIEGVWFPDGGMHAVPAALAAAAEKAGAHLMFGSSVTGPAAVQTRAGWPASSWPMANGSPPMPSCARLDLPTAYATLLPDLAPPRRPARQRPQPVRGRVACRRGRPSRPGGGAPQHPLRRRVGPGVRCVAAPAPADARPVAAGHRAVGGRPGGGPGRLLDDVRARARAEPAADIDWNASEGRCATDCRLPGPHGYPTDVVTELLVTPLDWQARGHGGGDAVLARAHVPPDRAVPPAERREAGARDVFRRFRDGARAWACRWC